MVKDRQR